MDKDLRIEMNEQVARSDFANLTLQRIHYSVYMLRTFDGEVCLLPQQWVLAGDLFSVKVVCNRCRRVVKEWEEAETARETAAANRRT